MFPRPLASPQVSVSCVAAISNPTNRPTQSTPPTTKRTRSFCGDTYDKWGEVDLDNPDHDKYRCDMTLPTSSDTEAGGWWTMSVYELPQDVDMEELSLNAVSSAGSGGTGETHQEGTDAGGETVVDEDGLGPVESGKRAFTVVNQCSQKIRVGATGGR